MRTMYKEIDACEKNKCIRTATYRFIEDVGGFRWCRLQFGDLRIGMWDERKKRSVQNAYTAMRYHRNK